MPMRFSHRGSGLDGKSFSSRRKSGANDRFPPRADQPRGPSRFERFQSRISPGRCRAERAGADRRFGRRAVGVVRLSCRSRWRRGGNGALVLLGGISANALPPGSNALGWRCDWDLQSEHCALSGAEGHPIVKRDQVGRGRTFGLCACDLPVDDRKPCLSRHRGEAERDAASGNCREEPAPPTDMAEQKVRAPGKQPERDPEHSGHRFPINPTSANWKTFTVAETAPRSLSPNSPRETRSRLSRTKTPAAATTAPRRADPPLRRGLPFGWTFSPEPRPLRSSSGAWPSLLVTAKRSAWRDVGVA
jgi:hypothetical protein